MKKVTYLFLACSVIFLIGKLMAYMDVFQPWWLKNYLDDLLCMPIILGICLKGTQLLKRNKNIRISLFSALSLAAFYSLYFEVILPPLMERYTADIFDVFLYFTGALIFYFLQKSESLDETVSEKQKAAKTGSL